MTQKDGVFSGTWLLPEGFPSQALTRQLPQRGSQGERSDAREKATAVTSTATYFQVYQQLYKQDSSLTSMATA